MNRGITLRQREGEPEGFYEATKTLFGVETSKYSVVDFGKTMASAPNIESLRKAGLFLGWEAIKIKEDGTLDTDMQFRGETWEDISNLL